MYTPAWRFPETNEKRSSKRSSKRSFQKKFKKKFSKEEEEKTIYLSAENHATGEEEEDRQKEDTPLLSPIRAAVHRLGDRTDDRLNERKLRPEAERAEHGEEENRPEATDGHARDGLGVGDEGQTRPLRDDIAHLGVHLIRHEADDGEDDEARKDGRQTVAHADVEGVSAEMRKRIF